MSAHTSLELASLVAATKKKIAVYRPQIPMLEHMNDEHAKKIVAQWRDGMIDYMNSILKKALNNNISVDDAWTEVSVIAVLVE